MILSKHRLRIWTAFSKEETEMATKYLRNCSLFLSIKEMQIQTALRFDLTPVRMERTRARGHPCSLLGLQMGVATVEVNVENSLKKPTVNLLHEAAVLLLGLCPEVSPSYSTWTCSAR